VPPWPYVVSAGACHRNTCSKPNPRTFQPIRSSRILKIRDGAQSQEIRYWHDCSIALCCSPVMNDKLGILVKAAFVGAWLTVLPQSLVGLIETNSRSPNTIYAVAAKRRSAGEISTAPSSTLHIQNSRVMRFSYPSKRSESRFRTSTLVVTLFLGTCSGKPSGLSKAITV
jgi:hypothetical protein